MNRNSTGNDNAVPPLASRDYDFTTDTLALFELGDDFAEATNEPSALNDVDNGDEALPQEQQQHLLPYAPSLEEYFRPLGTASYRPRPEWLTKYLVCDNPPMRETVLTAAIGLDATEAALALIQLACESISADDPSLLRASALLIAFRRNGHTPLQLASKRCNVSVVQALLQQPRVMANEKFFGRALSNAARFGHVEIMELLLQSGLSPNQVVNPLIAATQEGQMRAVEFLLHNGADVHHQNGDGTTALLEAAYGGDVSICRMLLQAGAQVNHQDGHGSTALILACQRGHVAVVRVLLAAGCELYMQDQSGQTVQSFVASVETNQELSELLNPIVQLHLMQQATRVERNRKMTHIHALLQQQRADVDAFSLPNPDYKALIRTMELPSPLVQSITSFLPLPFLWIERINMLQSTTCAANANAAIFNALDLFDEVLEEGGFLTACDVAQVPPPMPHASWAAWRRSASSNAPRRIFPPHARGINATDAWPPGPYDDAHPTIYELRRQVGYIPLLSQYQYHSNLLSILMEPPYRMPQPLLQELILTSDIASFSRRFIIAEPNSGMIFEVGIARNLVFLAYRLCSWYRQEREY